MNLYDLSDWPTMEEAKRYGFDTPHKTKHPSRCLKGRRTGEFRPPKAGEWFLSGAIPAGYRTKNDLDGAYYILELVVASKREVWEVEGMCMNVAPGVVASTVPPDSATGLLKTPWCHLPTGHNGSHACGDAHWE